MALITRIPKDELSLSFDYRLGGSYRYQTDATKLVVEALRVMGYRGKWTLRYQGAVKSRAEAKLRLTTGGYGVYIIVKPAGQDSAFKAQLVHPIEYTDSAVVASIQSYCQMEYGSGAKFDSLKDLPAPTSRQEALIASVVAAAEPMSNGSHKGSEPEPATQEADMSKPASLQGFIDSEECVAIVLKTLLDIVNVDNMVDRDVAITAIHNEVSIDASPNAIGGVLGGLTARGYVVKHDDLSMYEVTAKGRMLVRKHYPNAKPPAPSTNGSHATVNPGDFFGMLHEKYQQLLKGRELKRRLDDVQPRIEQLKTKKAALEKQAATIKKDLDDTSRELQALHDAVVSWDGPSPAECEKLEKEIGPFVGMLEMMAKTAAALSK